MKIAEAKEICECFGMHATNSCYSPVDAAKAIIRVEEINKNKLLRYERILKEIWDIFYGQNLGVTNWHLSGEIEPIDTFFENNDWKI